MIHQVILVIKLAFTFNLKTDTKFSSSMHYLGVDIYVIFFIDFSILSAFSLCMVKVGNVFCYLVLPHVIS